MEASSAGSNWWTCRGKSDKGLHETTLSASKDLQKFCEINIGINVKILPFYLFTILPFYPFCPFALLRFYACALLRGAVVPRKRRKQSHPGSRHHSPSEILHPATSSCQSVLRSLLKDMEEYECFRFRIGAQNGPATELCHLVVRGSLILLFLANAIAISSAIAP